MTSEVAISKLERERSQHAGLSMRQWYRTIYLKSDHWKALRKAAKATHGKICACCSRTERLDVHHLNYKNIYDVTPADLQVLCRKCHAKEHGAELPQTRLKRPAGVPRKAWQAWLDDGCRGEAPPAFVQRANHGNPQKRPPGVPKKEWAAWLAGGSVGPQPRPVAAYYAGRDERKEPSPSIFNFHPQLNRRTRIIHTRSSRVRGLVSRSKNRPQDDRSVRSAPGTFY